LRRFIKNGGNIDELAPEIIEMAAEWNDNLPRKILGYMMPTEAFAQELMKIKEAIVA
jgi:IS30 family transposase